MRRVIEKLAQERKKKEEEFQKKIDEIKEKSKVLQEIKASLRPSKISLPQKRQGLLSLFSRSKKFIPQEPPEPLSRYMIQTHELISSLLNLIELQASLMDAKDKEWDALGNNHVGIIFKSMEWRVDKLASEYEDVKILMKKFLLLKEKLNRLLAVLEKKKAPAVAQVREILEPLEDWRYMSFENRFRGYEEAVKKQQENYLAYFKKGGKVLDLGCGRGEFMELLKKRGIKGMGIDSNSQMVETCLDKGLNCQKGDILEKLAEWKNVSLDGIFSSQVIEHLPPAYLKKMIDLCFEKLRPSGVLVLETINPTSVFALVQIYFLDLSHQMPIHPLALKFLLETAGFEDVEIKYSDGLSEDRLQNLPAADETTRILNQNIDSLNKLLYSAPNYATIGRKK